MTDNPYDNYYPDNSQMNTEDNVYRSNEYSQNPASQPIDNLGSAYSHEVSDNVNYEQSEYTYPYKEDAQKSIPVGSYEWYGNTPVPPQPACEVKDDEVQSIRPPKKEKHLPLVIVLLICMVVSVVFGAGSAVVANHFFSDKSEQSVTVVQQKEDTEASDITNVSPLTTELLTSDIVEKYADSVVEIITESVQTGVFSQQYIESGAGSGVIIDSEGYIITNHHVIDGARKISITLRNGETYTAKLIGSDYKMDLALLKVEAENISAAVLGNSDSLKVGQRTIAIGNPLGQLGGTVTEGIISALDRDVTVDGQTMNLLQTDTAINPGNSGGGLFDGNGNLIGIVVAKSSGSEVEGLGFAIPINDAVNVIADLMDYGYVRGRVSIGMEFIDVTSEPVAWMYGLSELGCYVYSVDKGSNAEESGFKSGDLILKIDGEKVSSSEDVESILDSKKVGDSVEFTVRRGGRTGTLTLTLEEYVPTTTTEDDDYIQWYN